MTITVRRLKDTTYFAPARVLIGHPDETQDWLRTHYDDHEGPDPSVSASTLQYTTSGWTEWVTVFAPACGPSLTVSELSTVAHESFHLATRILRNRGVSLTEASEEAFAYLIGALFTQLVEARAADAVRRSTTTKTKTRTKHR